VRLERKAVGVVEKRQGLAKLGAEGDVVEGVTTRAEVRTGKEK
jgi:hypothetical protein